MRSLNRVWFILMYKARKAHLSEAKFNTQMALSFLFVFIYSLHFVIVQCSLVCFVLFFFLQNSKTKATNKYKLFLKNLKHLHGNY